MRKAAISASFADAATASGRPASSAVLIHCRNVSWFTLGSAAIRETGRPDDRANATASAWNSAEYL
ncbi:hypothetical protein ADK54_40415 [Streptomyces sp. WM6378]|nr:hypothetical protein ADK54_40415 [Streptomyces sp. WM6378]